jgi:hypothetical protein
MFNPDFYPTPPDVAATMLDPLDLRGKVVVEQHRRPEQRRRGGVAA